MEPKNAAEYLALFQSNQHIKGFGIGNVHIHMPCPFCAAADFLVYEILQCEVAMGKGATCRQCGRGAKTIYTRTPGSLSFEIVQTEGPDQPEWLKPKMRRLS